LGGAGRAGQYFKSDKMSALNIIKIGGNVIDDPQLLDGFLTDFASLPGPKILVHGGGKIATGIGEKLGITANYVQGRRVTDAATIDLVTMVYAGLVNKKLVAALQSKQCHAIGLTGADANCLPAIKRPVTTIDYGWVADLKEEKMDGSFWTTLLADGLVPVIAPLTHDGQGQLLNINADTIAAVLAMALCAKMKLRLFYCFEKSGILLDVQNEQSVLHEVNKKVYQEMKTANQLSDGILPKLDNALQAIEQGVQAVWIGHAKDILAAVNGETVGTTIQ
jgi:acetylglutamate kinase